MAGQDATVTVEGLDRVIRIFGNFGSATKDIADDVMGVTAQQMMIEATRIVPVDTGNLKRSIEVTHKEQAVYYVGASAPYAGYVEYGTKFQQAQPYMRPALETSVPQAQNMLPAIIAQRLR